MIGKGICDKEFTWNSSNCECESDESWDVREYLDYENCNCRKKTVDKLVEECSENIDGNKIIYNGTANAIPLNDYKKVCDSCAIYIALFIIFLIINLSISCVFIYLH